RVYGNSVHRPTRGRSVRPDDSWRRHDHRWHRRAEDNQLAMGRLHRYNGRSDRRLHVLVRKRVLHVGGSAIVNSRLANTNRHFQATWLQLAVITDGPGAHNSSAKECLGSSIPGDPKFFVDVVFSSAATL